ncbi:MAG: hypothetical protein ABSA18_15230 [Dehalococcoidia bacterium]
MKSTSWKQLILYLVIFAGLCLVFNLAGGCLGTPASTDSGQGTKTSSANQLDSNSNLRVINVADLTPEGRTTLQLIK